MVIRRRRKVRKQRGSRTMGGGSVKKRRGAGDSGGKGLAGGHKHKWFYILKHAPEHFGKRGFTRPAAVRRSLKSVNVGELDQHLEELVEAGVARREGEKFVVDVGKLGFDKVLGGGKVSGSLKVIAREFSESAKKKLEDAGGKAVVR